MRTAFWLLLSAVVASSGCAWHFPFPAVQGSGTVVAESREVDDFRGISLNGSADLFVHVGRPVSVTVEIDDNLLEIITTEVRHDRLVIGNEQNYRSTHGLRVYVTAPSLEYCGLQGSGNVDIQGLDSEEFQLSLNGSGDITGTGTTEYLRVQVNGSGDINLVDVTAKDISVTINGSGDVRVHALEHLSASIHGSGDIRYQGSPVVEQSIHGSGSVSQMAE